MAERKFIGVLTPSSNTALEPLTSAILACVPNVSAHFGRFRVTSISLQDSATLQFDQKPIMAAADLLADTLPGVIAWSGTSASWLGVTRDEQLCAELAQRYPVQATTSVLAINEAIALKGITTIGLVSPYKQDVQDLIIKNYAARGLPCVSEVHLGITVNRDFGLVDETTLEATIRKVAAARPGAILVMCTNLRAAQLVQRLEQELHVPIYDSVAAVVWKSLRMLGLDARRVTGWGELFSYA